MRRPVAVLSLLSLLLLPGVAQTEQSTRYVSLKIGRTMPVDVSGSGVTLSFEDGYNFTGAAGIHLLSSVRLEVEGSYRRFDLGKARVGNTTVTPKGDIDYTSMMGNVYYDFHNDSPMTPYLFAGIGHTWVSTQVALGAAKVKASGDGMAYQAGLGLSIAMGQNWSADLEYRRFGVNNDSVDDFASNEIMAGLRYGF
jgi:opacity protein-like surface antigen